MSPCALHLSHSSAGKVSQLCAWWVQVSVWFINARLRVWKPLVARVFKQCFATLQSMQGAVLTKVGAGGGAVVCSPLPITYAVCLMIGLLWHGGYAHTIPSPDKVSNSAQSCVLSFPDHTAGVNV